MEFRESLNMYLFVSGYLEVLKKFRLFFKNIMMSRALNLPIENTKIKLHEIFRHSK